MKKCLFLLTVFAFALILSGCGAETQNPLANPEVAGGADNNSPIASVSSSAGQASNSVLATSSQVASSPKKTVQRFYPSDLSPKPASSDDSAGASTGSKNSSPSFSVTQELQLKLYLVDKYSPGVCYGLPTPVPEQAISGMLADNPDMVKFLKGKYDLKTDLDVYKKMKQIFGISLSSDKGGYIYEFTDGQCCTLHAYQGRITIIGNNITDTVLQQQTQSNPC